MNGVIRFALGLANMPDKTVADLDKALPGMARLASAAKELEPILVKAEPHVEALVPLFAAALPIIKREWSDVVAVLPTIEELIAFVNKE